MVYIMVETLRRQNFPVSEEFTNEEVLTSINLELRTDPEFDYLSMWIQDPENPRQYALRKVQTSSPVDSVDEKEFPYVDVGLIDLQSFHSWRIPEAELERRVGELIHQERYVVGPDSVAGEIQASVGVVTLKKETDLQIDDLAMLAGVQYSLMKALVEKV
ncbi:hypothetical protein ACFL1B_06225 [Nanoarchaeota archaeon]